MGIDTEQKGNEGSKEGPCNRERTRTTRKECFYISLPELRSPPRMKTMGRNSRVRRTIEHHEDEEEDEKEKDHLQWA
jgi:hypothetical protein